MNSNMARNTDRNNIKRLGIVRMMVIPCLFAAGTFQGSCLRHLFNPNCFVNNSACYNSFRMPFAIFRGFASMLSLAFIGFAILNDSFFDNISAFFALSILFNSSFAFFSLAMAIYSGFSLLALPKCFLVNLILFTLVVCSFAGFTARLKSVFCRTVFIKFRDWFNSFACAASFCYDLLRHNLLQHSKLRLELITAHTVVGSFYNNRYMCLVNQNIKNIKENNCAF